MLRGGPKVSVSLLQQLQSVFHRHLHRDTQRRENKVVSFKGSAQINRTSQQGVMGKWVQFSAIHLEDQKRFNYLSSNNPIMKRQHGKCYKMSSPLEVQSGNSSSEWGWVAQQPTLCRFSLSYVCYMYKTDRCDVHQHTKWKSRAPHCLGSSILHLLEVLISQQCTCASGNCKVARLLQPHCDDSIDHNVIEKHTMVIYGGNPGNRHPNSNNSLSP